MESVLWSSSIADLAVARTAARRNQISGLGFYFLDEHQSLPILHLVDFYGCNRNLTILLNRSPSLWSGDKVFRLFLLLRSNQLE